MRRSEQAAFLVTAAWWCATGCGGNEFAATPGAAGAGGVGASAGAGASAAAAGDSSTGGSQAGTGGQGANAGAGSGGEAGLGGEAGSGGDAGSAGTAGEAGTAGAGATDAGQPDGNPCAVAGEVPCGGQCKNIQTDPAHCGACDSPCVDGRICGAAKCVCAPPGRDCAGTCKDTDNDPQNCGDCGRACSTNHVAPAHCTTGVCDGPCASGFEDCDGDKFANGCEVNIATDPKSCGACGKACPPSQRCVSGHCARVVFVSSLTIPGSLSPLGTHGDQKCRSVASSASLPGDFVAWLAAPSSLPTARLNQPAAGDSYYVRTDNVVIATNFASFASTIHKAAIDRTEKASIVSGTLEVWTGANADGTATGVDCSGWTSNTNAFTGSVGNAAKTTLAWTNDGTVACAESRHLYCVQK